LLLAVKAELLPVRSLPNPASLLSPLKHLNPLPRRAADISRKIA